MIPIGSKVRIVEIGWGVGPPYLGRWALIVQHGEYRGPIDRLDGVYPDGNMYLIHILDDAGDCIHECTAVGPTFGVEPEFKGKTKATFWDTYLE